MVSFGDDNFARTVDETYKQFQVCCVRGVRNTNKDAGLGWKDISSLYSKLTSEDKATWCIENGGDKSKSGSIPSNIMLSPMKNGPEVRAYCSFLLQKDKESYQRTLRLLPFKCFDSLRWNYESTLWIFFGRNPIGKLPLQGRKEHTDSVSHDGTWHYQLSGRKRWFLRPTKELLRTVPTCVGSGEVFEVECNKDDVLLLNTRLWRHRTEIPAQAEPSVSYARDFCYETNTNRAAQPAIMTNVDGLYAMEDIDAGTVIFTEDTMPDCEIHRSQNPNCELVELESGVKAVVSTVTIASGEFFCIAESDDDEEENDGTGTSEDEDDSRSDWQTTGLPRTCLVVPDHG